MSKFISTYGCILSACAMLVAEYTARFCFFVFHQPEIPESVKVLRNSRLLQTWPKDNERIRSEPPVRYNNHIHEEKI